MKLYPALFENATHHISIIHALGSKWKGLTRQEIIKETALPDGGNLSRYLNELLHSGFISLYNAFGKKQKDVLYRLTDEYSLFYLHFIQHQNKYQFTKDTWQNLSQTPTFKSWTGYAFENLCLKHIDQIKKALGISGIYSETSSYYHQGKADQQGVQIDLLIDRKDNVINIFELKFYVEPFILAKSYANNLREKMSVFKQLTGTRKQIFISLLSVFGIKPNEYSIGLISNSMAVDVLFEEV
jgi:hypothetical protein